MCLKYSTEGWHVEKGKDSVSIGQTNIVFERKRERQGGLNPTPSTVGAPGSVQFSRSVVRLFATVLQVVAVNQ